MDLDTSENKTSLKCRIPTTVNVKEFRELLHKISRNISKNFENCTENFQKSLKKNSEDFEKYFRHFRGVISKNFENKF